jgi:hypothetical protein
MHHQSVSLLSHRSPIYNANPSLKLYQSRLKEGEHSSLHSSFQRLLDTLVATLMDVNDIACGGALAQLSPVFDRIEAFLMFQLCSDKSKCIKHPTAAGHLHQCFAMAKTFHINTLQSLSLLLCKAQMLPSTRHTAAEMATVYTEELTTLMLLSAALQGQLISKQAQGAWLRDLQMHMLEDDTKYRFAWEQAAVLVQV